MPSVAELRKFLRENKDASCRPYSKLSKNDLLEMAISMGYVMEEKPRVKKPQVKKSVVSEVQTVGKKRIMAPQEIKSIVDVKTPIISEVQTVSRRKTMTPKTAEVVDIKKPVVYSIQGVTKRTQMKPQQFTESVIVPIDPKELRKDNMAYNQHAARYKMLTGETLPKWSEQSPEIRDTYDYVDWYAAILSNTPGWLRPRRR